TQRLPGLSHDQRLPHAAAARALRPEMEREGQRERLHQLLPRWWRVCRQSDAGRLFLGAAARLRDRLAGVARLRIVRYAGRQPDGLDGRPDGLPDLFPGGAVRLRDLDDRASGSSAVSWASRLAGYLF